MSRRSSDDNAFSALPDKSHTGSSRMGRSICMLKLSLFLAVLPGIILAITLRDTEDVFYRAQTAFDAIVQIAKLPEQDVQHFIQAFSMFDMNNFTGTPEQMKLVEAYYNILPHLTAIGNFEKMYLPPMLDPSKDTYSNQKLFEIWMSHQLNVSNKTATSRSAAPHVLDIGCGRGRIAHLVATETGAHVTGLNIAVDQIASANMFARKTGMAQQLEFVHGNYNHRLPFDDEMFDALYYVQVIGGYGTNLTALFTEAYRVLKPGSRIVLEDYILLPAFDSSNKKHQELMRWSRSILGGVDFFPDTAYTDALRMAGFRTLSRGKHSTGEQVQLLRQDVDFFVPLGNVVSALAYIGIVPQHFKTMLDRLNQGAEACVEAHKLGLLTGDIVTVAEKPAP